MSYILTFILVFVAMFFADVCWVWYFISIEERKSVLAGLWGAIIYLFSAFTITNYVNDKTLLIPAVIGSFLGTYVVVIYKKRKEKNNNGRT